MKKDYKLKSLLMLLFIVFSFQQSNAQIRIVEADPSTNRITIRNYGSSSNPQNISNFWLCQFPTYNQLNGMTVISGSLNLAVGSEVTLTSSINFDAGDGELGLYNTSSFGSSTAMEDYMQWGTAGHQRESVAVAKGIWTAGTTISVAPPFEYVGDGSQNGIAFWETLLGIEDFESGSNINIYPNPTQEFLYIHLSSETSNASIEIFDILGKAVLNASLNSENLTQINVANWDSGLYLIKITANESIDTKRFIKN